jgi:diguanylate cyclase (GGDEF)-like protein/PAS domain S-box-containing protein
VEATLRSVAISEAVQFVCLGLLLWLLMRALVVRPLVRFKDQVAALSASGQETPIDLGRVDVGEIATLQLGFNGLMRRLAASRVHIEEQNAVLQHDKAQIQCIVDSIPDLIFIKDRNGVYLGCNKALEAFFGRRADQIVGSTDLELFEPALAAEVRQEDHDLMRTGSMRVVEHQLAYPDGRKVCLETVKTLFFGPGGELLGLVGIARDITDRKAVEEQLRLASLVYRNSSEGMVATDEDNRIIAINPAFAELSGYSEDEVLGKNPSMFGSDRQDPGVFREMWHALEASGRWKGEIWNRHKAGHEYAVWLTVNTIFTGEGKVHRRVALFSDITEKKKADNLIWAQANYDYLTGLPNRRLFQDRLGQEIKKAHRDRTRLAVLFIDLDRFKEVNDTLGHNMGDVLLVEAADRIRNRLREYDTLSRFGGDEFMVILSGLCESAVVSQVSMDMIARLSEPFVLGGHEAYVSASVGIALYPDDADSVTDLVKHADQAMYAAKAMGRGRFNFFTKSLQEASELRIRIASDLRHALKEEQMELYYQPIVDLATGRIRKAEALLRWKHPVLGYISPATFIPIAEDTGTIQQIGDWVFRVAVEQVRRWRAELMPALQISVNMSPVQFLRDGRSHAHWVEHLRDAGVPGDGVAIEITEGLLMSAEPVISDTLLSFRDAGIQVAIDDFGTGYSALSYLKKFHIDYLKIDRTFTNNLAPDSPDLALCEAIVVMAHKLDMKVIAEGVETNRQHALLQRIDCDYGQGFLFARPASATVFEDILRQIAVATDRA